MKYTQKQQQVLNLQGWIFLIIDWILPFTPTPGWNGTRILVSVLNILFALYCWGMISVSIKVEKNTKPDESARDENTDPPQS